jgi:hypothetical protein
MITDPDRTQAISHLSWVDQGSIWVYRLGERAPDVVPLSDANRLRLHNGAGGYFAVTHLYDGQRLAITVHHHRDPEEVLAALDCWVPDSDESDEGNDPWMFSGSAAWWSQVPRAYLGYAGGEPRLLLVDGAASTIEFQKLGWYNDRYDRAQQGVVGVTAIPDSSQVLFSVQRDSNLVLYDTSNHRALRRVPLADRAGNPTPSLRQNASEVWAVDYDTLVAIDTETWRTRASLLLQEADERGGLRFVGAPAFDEAEELCVVGRPFSGDVLGIDVHRFAITHVARLGGEPLDVAVLMDGHVVARDWHAGLLRQGDLHRARPS